MTNKYAKLKVAAVTLFTIITTAPVIAAPAPYFGGQLGYGIANQENMSTKDSSGVAGRLFAGYAFNSYLSTELGWTKFSNASAPLGGSWGIYDADGNFIEGQTASGKTTVKTSALDLVLKGTLPVTDKMNVYGKAGIAYIMATSNSHLNVEDKVGNTVVKTTHYSHSEDHQDLFPTFGVGASYAVTPKVTTDVSYNRIQKVGSASIDSTDFLGVGLTYSFG